ncbi:hypothetical protein X965_04780 [Morganella sp. EGD-HP17]|nr:hypothetical protein X965_04780 [Morganella sp. EGD-HP17]
MDEPVKKKYNIAFMALLLIMLSVFYIWLSVVYFSDYINKKDIIKVHIGQFFILSVPLLLYFASGSIMIFLNKEKFLKKHKFFKVLFYIFLSLAIFSFYFINNRSDVHG